MLPHVLLDLLCHRLSASTIQSYPRVHIRLIQQLKIHDEGPPLDGNELQVLHRNAHLDASERPTRNDHTLRLCPEEKTVQAVSILEERVAKLKDATAMLGKNQRDDQDGPRFPEADLRDIYRDLLSFPEADWKAPTVQPTLDPMDKLLDIIQILEERLPTFEMLVDVKTARTTLSSKLHARLNHPSLSLNREPDNSNLLKNDSLQQEESSLRTLVKRLRAVLDTLQDSRPPTDAHHTPSVTLPIPLGFFSNGEWGTLLQTCLQGDDAQTSEEVLRLMKRSGLLPSNEQYDAILDWYATRGLVDEAESFILRLKIEISRDRQRDLLIKARLNARQLDDACALIHSFEKRTSPAPMQSYTRVIQALLSFRGPGSEQYMAQAWDMFSHMRYVAHSEPDHFLYTLMMRACAKSTDAEPERALDLFTEMTVDKNIAPTTYAYNAVILACARSKKFALEAFRLAREMLNAHRDAYGETPLRLLPDNDTFCALLEAAKRVGDLPRARMILAQMTNSVRSTRVDLPIYVDERTMIHVFHAYASYRPPFRRETVELMSGEESKSKVNAKEKSSSPFTQSMVVADVHRRRSAPQTRQEVLNEASALWERIIEDRRSAADDSSVFGRVSLTTSLLNAYMAVHYAHSPPSAAYQVYNDLFEALRVPRDQFTYVLALEAYAQGKRTSKPELQVALSVAQESWKRWQKLETASISQTLSKTTDSDSHLDARMVERAWTAMMRLLALNGRMDEAIDLLHQFVRRYPPGSVKQPSFPGPTRSTRTSLYADRPLVRLRERSAVPEDRITPFLTFRDLSLLHHCAVANKRTKDIVYITWVAKTYEGALRRRRDATLRGVAGQE